MEEFREVVRHRLAGTFTPVGIELQGNIATIVTQTTIELQHATQILGVAIADAIVGIVVLDNTILLGNLINIAQRVVGIVVRILVEGGACTRILTVTGTIRETWTEHDISHRVGLPLKAHLAVPLIAAREALAETIAERRCGSTEDRLTRGLREGVTIVMVPAHASVYLQLIAIIVVQVQTRHLRGVQALTTSTESATAATTGETHIVSIVGIGHEEQLEVVLHHATKDTARITVFGTGCQVGINHDTLVHTGLNTKIEDGFLFTVLNA